MAGKKKPNIRTASPILRSIFKEMENRGVSQYAMAEQLRKSQARVQAWSAGKVEPGVMTAEEMAHHLGYRLVLEPIGETDHG